MQWQSPVLASIPVYNLRLINYLASHPLLNSDLVLDPLTGEPINIIAYRQKGGLSSQPGLICSVYPAFQATNTAPPNPTATGVSTIYRDFTIGNNQIEAMYHFIVEFTLFYEVSYDNNTLIEDIGLGYLAEVPVRGVVSIDEPYIPPRSKQVEIYVDPPQLIIGTYQELAVLAFNDLQFKSRLNIPELRAIDVVHANLPTSYKWEQGTNVIISTCSIYLRLHTYQNKDWKRSITDNFRIRKTNLVFDNPNAPPDAVTPPPPITVDPNNPVPPPPSIIDPLVLEFDNPYSGSEPYVESAELPSINNLDPNAPGPSIFREESVVIKEQTNQ